METRKETREMYRREIGRVLGWDTVLGESREEMPPGKGMVTGIACHAQEVRTGTTVCRRLALGLPWVLVPGVKWHSIANKPWTSPVYLKHLQIRYNSQNDVNTKERKSSHIFSAGVIIKSTFIPWLSLWTQNSPGPNRVSDAFTRGCWPWPSHDYHGWHSRVVRKKREEGQLKFVLVVHGGSFSRVEILRVTETVACFHTHKSSECKANIICLCFGFLDPFWWGWGGVGSHFLWPHSALGPACGLLCSTQGYESLWNCQASAFNVHHPAECGTCLSPYQVLILWRKQ